MPAKERIKDVGVMSTPKTFDQLGILVLDGSGSMGDASTGTVTKAEAVSEAVREMLTRFRRSRYKQNFSFAVVTFDHFASVHTPVTPAAEINDGGDYDPMREHGGGTAISTGLREAQRIADDFLFGAPTDIPSSVVIVVMSDGIDGDVSGTLRIAEEIKSNPEITICATYFSQEGQVDEAAQGHLRKLVSDPSGFETIHDMETLRNFFIVSVSTGTNTDIRNIR